MSAAALTRISGAAQTAGKSATAGPAGELTTLIAAGGVETENTRLAGRFGRRTASAYSLLRINPLYRSLLGNARQLRQYTVGIGGQSPVKLGISLCLFRQIPNRISLVHILPRSPAVYHALLNLVKVEAAIPLSREERYRESGDPIVGDETPAARIVAIQDAAGNDSERVHHTLDLAEMSAAIRSTDEFGHWIAFTRLTCPGADRTPLRY